MFIARFQHGSAVRMLKLVYRLRSEAKEGRLMKHIFSRNQTNIFYVQ